MYDEDNADSISAPKFVVSKILQNNLERSHRVVMPTSPVWQASQLLESKFDEMRGNSPRNEVAKEEEEDHDGRGEGASMRMISTLGLGKAISTLTGVTEKRRRGANASGSVRERSIVGSVAELFGRGTSDKNVDAAKRRSTIMQVSETRAGWGMTKGSESNETNFVRPPLHLLRIAWPSFTTSRHSKA